MNCAREISKFFQEMSNECRPWTDNPFSILSGCEAIPAKHPVDESPTSIVPLITGSRAELFVVPTLSCMGDVDVMFHYTNELALPAGCLPPTHLPTVFDTNVRVYEIVDSPFPCYVYLQSLYLLAKCSSDKSFKVTLKSRNKERPLNHSLYTRDIHLHGPARRYEQQAIFAEGTTHVDIVKCVHCTVWPPQAAGWPTRSKKYGWPSPPTIACVLKKGCDVVPIAHNLCREDEWTSKHQWRLSFSRAEVLLLNSWTAEQQIVYHMLRVFVKNEQLVDSGENVLSNYHLKTLMLWACEKKPQSWWTDADGLVSVCVQLLKCLGSWLADARCQHYFVSRCNLFGHFSSSMKLQTQSALLRSIIDDSLARWFVHNYIQKCSELCPDNAAVKLDHIQTTMQIENVRLAVERWKDLFVLRNAVKEGEALFSIIVAFLHDDSSQCALHLFSIQVPALLIKSMHSAHVPSAFNMIVFSLYWRFEPFRRFYGVSLDFLAYILPKFRAICYSNEQEKFQGIPSSLFSKKSSTSSLSKATALIKVVATKLCGLEELQFVELAKLYSHMALNSNDSTSESVYCQANVYMALLYYITGHYQRALDHCTLVTIARMHLQCKSKAIQGEVLPKTDDNIDHALGLAVLYHYIRTSVLTRQSESFQSGGFTTELFARYFTIKHLLTAKCCVAPKSLADSTALSVQVLLRKELEAYRKDILRKDSLFVCDLLLILLPGVSFGSCGILPSRSLTLTELIQLMRRNSVVRQMSFRYKRRQGFDAVVTSDFEILYLYRCFLYERCIRRCQKTVGEQIETAGDDMSQTMSLTFSDFIELMDSDVVSVLGLAMLINRAMRHTLSTVRISELCLSLYLMALCQLQLDHPATLLHVTLDLIAVAYEAANSSSSRVFDRATLQLGRSKLAQRTMHVKVPSHHDDVLADDVLASAHLAFLDF